MKTWQLQEAKAQFSEVVRRAQRVGPQTVSVHGKDAVVVLASEDYARLSGSKPSFLEMMRASPLVGVRLRIDRDKQPTRKVKL